MSQETEKLLHPLSGKHIIISGAGIAGLAFARGLDRQWPRGVPPPKVTLYERDDRHLPVERGNYSLGLRSDAMSGGIQAIRELGMLDQIINASVPGSSSGGNVRDHNWEPLVKFRLPKTPPDGLPVSNMRITRNSIRETFIQGLPSRVQARWGIQCTSAHKSQSGAEMTVLLSDGTSAHCDLLVVADGASSKLRSSLRPTDTLQFRGAVCIGGNAFFPSGEVPAHLVSEGFGPVIGGNGIGLVVFPIDDCSAVWFLTQRASEPRTPVHGAQALAMKDAIMAEVMEKGAVFGNEFKELLDATDPKTLKIFNAQDKRPITHSEAADVPAVFIGDSNHAVSPFAGNGANMALMDGVSLSTALCEENSSIASAIAAFDKESRGRCTKAWRISHVVIRMIHAQGIWLWFVVCLLRTLFWFVK